MLIGTKGNEVFVEECFSLYDAFMHIAHEMIVKN